MSSYSEGQTHQLMEALEVRGKFTGQDVTSLGQFSDLPGIKDVVRGHAKIVWVEHIINCDVQPFTPSGWSVEKHTPGGQWPWDPSKIILYLSKKQKKSGTIEGNKLRQELEKLEGMLTLNANVLDYLLAHPEIIPEEWKGKAVFFWGTIYRHSDGYLIVRCLYWDGSQWDWDNYWFGSDFDGNDPAAVSASI